CLQDKELPVTF
nr:immunoglobulin light chain junction region [Macaca mulatta]MOX08151.1 immunoglobulin light chain junction region [Macaca mulatta]MOX08541.1 immunoglobulin light chain junction region [Macaca mulatta]MOX08713.1 immunoglobulin light chain junction region [Macaca mulatta]MOX08813.1 immunoglobulin light chain junction region [Macaca mulatta]